MGAIGGYYAAKFFCSDYNLKVLVDRERFERYNKDPRVINNKVYEFDYVMPDYTGYIADMVIIATKSDGLLSAIDNIEHFVGDNTIIMSFLNGVTSENQIKEKYGEKVLYSYLLGHTFFRKGENIFHDGNARIFFGSPNVNDSRVDNVKIVFEKIGVGYQVSDDILTSLWKKF